MRFINQFSTVVHALLLFFFVMLVVIGCFYPGTLNLDSEWQLIQANQNIYHNGHPPLMSYIWHCLNLLFKTNSHLNMLVLIGSFLAAVLPVAELFLVRLLGALAWFVFVGLSVAGIYAAARGKRWGMPFIGRIANRIRI